MLRYFLFFLGICIIPNLQGQLPSGNELLEKSIAYHDPNNAWPSFKGTLQITMKTPVGKERVSAIDLNLPDQYFKLTSSQDGDTITQILDKGKCRLSMNGHTNISDEEIKAHNLTCERANTMKDYYTYLYGLPMKLKDPGTIVDPKVETKTFKGKEYLVLKITYMATVGKDTWYFYFDPHSYAMEIYQFYHDEDKKDGEYILLTGIEDALGIKIPKTRAWYYNKDDKYLGTDVLTNFSSL